MSGVHSSPVTRSWATAWRWVNVPRRESWPDMRTGTPSMRREPKASSSPKPQSMWPSWAILLRLSNSAMIFLCGVKPSGGVVWARPMRWRISGETAVVQPTIVPASSCWEAGMPSASAASASSFSAFFSASRASWNAFSSRAWKSSSTLAACSSEMSPRPSRASWYSWRVVRFSSTREYMIGWVIDGSSPSLWPRLR